MARFNRSRLNSGSRTLINSSKYLLDNQVHYITLDHDIMASSAPSASSSSSSSAASAPLVPTCGDCGRPLNGEVSFKCGCGGSRCGMCFCIGAHRCTACVRDNLYECKMCGRPNVTYRDRRPCFACGRWCCIDCVLESQSVEDEHFVIRYYCKSSCPGRSGAHIHHDPILESMCCEITPEAKLEAKIYELNEENKTLRDDLRNLGEGHRRLVDICVRRNLEDAAKQKMEEKQPAPVPAAAAAAPPPQAPARSKKRKIAEEPKSEHHYDLRKH